MTERQPAEDAYRWVGEAIESGASFNRTLGVVVDEVVPGRAVLRLPDGDHLHNHVGGPHAAALFGLGESAAAAVTVATFADLITQFVPLVKSAEIEYLRVVRGAASAVATFDDDPDQVRAVCAEKGLATFSVLVTLKDADGRDSGRMRARMALKHKHALPS
jgi:acyl-coenzyme A thioesterase PaaI-like protein